MKRAINHNARLVLILAFAMVSTVAMACTKPLAFKTKEINLGRVDAGTQNHHVAFEFTNRSKRAIQITDIQFKNGHMTVGWQESEIDPKTKTAIEVDWVPNYHWGEIPDKYAQTTPIVVTYTDGKKSYKQVLRLKGTIWLNRREVFNRREGKLNIHRLNAVWNYCLCGNTLDFEVQYANFTDKKIDVVVGLSDKQGNITRQLIHEVLNPKQESLKVPSIKMDGDAVTRSMHIAFYVDGKLQTVEPFEVILWDKADTNTKRAWKRARHFTFDIKRCQYENVYDAEDENEWKRLY